MFAALFWIALLITLWVYVGYPALLLVWRAVGRKPVRKRYYEPRVSIVIAMYNESGRVRAKMENCLSLDYPSNKLEILVSLDAPTDGTDVLVEGYASYGVTIVHSSERRGKAVAINSALTLASGEIVVFADARQRFAPNALRELTANFADDSVGAVSGELVLLDQEDREAADGVGLYWRYEKALRSMESEISSVPGTTGAIYAIRRDLFKPLPEGTILDDVLIPMRIVASGKRAIFEPGARAFDHVTDSPELEYQKKTRTLMGNYELITHAPELLMPWRNPIIVQFLSHKVGRLIVPYCLLVLLASNLFLLHGYYLVSLAGQVLFYSLAVGGWLISRGRLAMKTSSPEFQKVKEQS